MKRSLLATLIALSGAVWSQSSLTIVSTNDDGTTRLDSYALLPSATIPLDKGAYQFFIDNGSDCAYPLSGAQDTRVRFNQPITLSSCADKPLDLTVRVDGAIEFTFDTENQSVSLKLVPRQSEPRAFVRPLPIISCSAWGGEPVTVKVGETFAEGERVRDFYSGATTTVINGEVTLTPAVGSNGLLLIEPADAQPSDFHWDNALVYFVMTDRFHNGDTSNDFPFNRKRDGKDEIGTFHGGDIKGLINKLDYIEQLGANAIWMTPLVEQVHGFVGGGKNGDFPFYAYHGYWALDYTKLDPNFGDDEDLRTLVREAHKRGIRLIWDTVINHVGYATLEDLKTFDIDVMKSGVENLGNDWTPGPGETWFSYNDLINYTSANWGKQWWSPDWVRGTFPGYQQPGGDNLTLALAGLPDFITEDETPVGLPPILRNKPDTRAEDIRRRVSDHVIDWQVQWVREFGIDAFRSDTAKHVELERWAELKDRASEALREWRAENPDNGFEEDFWMVGEVFDHPLFKNYYYDYGFDSLINFEFQDKAPDLAMCMDNMEDIYSDYAQSINSDPNFNGLTYISSHDTTLFYAQYQSVELQKRIAAPFLLLPGGVQIYYGDETARPLGPYGDDFHQGTRSDMNWNDITGDRAALLAHWQKIGQFRNRHVAIGAGEHKLVSSQPYAFSRIKGDDRVLVVFAGNEQQK